MAATEIPEPTPLSAALSMHRMSPQARLWILEGMSKERRQKMLADVEALEESGSPGGAYLSGLRLSIQRSITNDLAAAA